MDLDLYPVLSVLKQIPSKVARRELLAIPHPGVDPIRTVWTTKHVSKIIIIDLLGAHNAIDWQAKTLSNIFLITA